MAVIPSGKKGSACEQFSKDAPNSPDINGLWQGSGSTNKKESNPMYLGIHFEGKHNLWCAIPPCSDVFCHQTDFLATSDTGFNTSGETKIANFKVAIGIKKKIGGLEVTMDDIGAMDRFERSEGLVDKVLG